MNTLRATWLLTIRALREIVRQPVNEVGNLVIPLFFFAVTVGAVGRVAERAFGVENFTGFQMPVAVLNAAASGTAGLAITQDVVSGYFEKLLLTPAPRFAVVFGRVTADSVKAAVLAALIAGIGLLVGTGFAAGPLGFLLLVGMAGAFGFVFSAFGVAFGLRTGSPQAAQLSFLLFFPLLFLSPAFAPKEVFAPWLSFAATINPVTYVLEGMRSLVLEGWDGGALLRAFGAIAGIGGFTLSLTAWALRSRG
ncbi:Daunorubicin/doxorubicin resistance ABC transporter permease protein DrrB [bacterium HR29]|nr:Daunorubicin/doxorubicin resistance ABC transporter permease protein DrrB [bacterium HR29]